MAATPERICVLGLGLMGGSLARGLAARGSEALRVACDLNAASLERARAEGVIEAGFQSPAQAVVDADLVVVATPPLALEAVLTAAAPALKADAVVTDVTSFKGAATAAATRALGPGAASFVPGHPIAGSERSGYAAASADLYEGRLVILTPGPDTRPEATARVRRLWQQLGARVWEMSAAEHDRELAHSSHLPHFLAYALVHYLVVKNRAGDRDATRVGGGDTRVGGGAKETPPDENMKNAFALAGGGLKDFTRIASSDPGMWRDIALGNREQILLALDGLGDELGLLRGLIEAGDPAAIEEFLLLAKQARDRALALQGSSPVAESSHSSG